MAKEKILNDDQFFSEIHGGFSAPVKIMNEKGLGELVGRKASVHLHSPATDKLGRPIYSVLVGGIVQGQTEDIYLKDTQMKVDKQQLAIHLASKTPENPEGTKTRNTFVSGIVHPPPVEPADRVLKVRPGSMTDANTGEDVSSGMSGTRLSKKTTKQGKTVPSILYTPKKKST